MSLSTEIRPLEQAFALFSQESERLKEGYAALQRDFRQTAERLDLVLHHLEEGILFVSEEGRCTLINDAAANLLEVTRSEITSKPLLDFFSPDFFGFSFEEKQLHKEIHLELSNKKQLNVLAQYLPGKGHLLVLRDMTEIEQLKRFSRHHETLQELGKMAAFLAHEIRNPLAAIAGFAQLLEKDLAGRHKEMASHIVEGTKRLSDLVSSILEFSRPLALHFKRHALDSLVSEAAHDYPCTFQLPASCFVLVDAPLFKAALTNLIKNGYEASQKKVALETEKQEGKVLLHVRDAGTGIEPKDQAFLFTPFFTTKKEGHGLGLAQSHKIISAHGGQLTYSANSLGSTFTIQLPCL